MTAAHIPEVPHDWCESGSEPYLGLVPDCEPPFDDQLVAGPSATASSDWFSSANLTAVPARTTSVTDPDVPGWSQDRDVGVKPTPARELPSGSVISRVLARAIMEVLAGYRQVGQLRALCSPEVFAGIQVRLTPGAAPPKLLSVRASEPADGVVEACAVFRRDSRCAAMAFRLQGVDGRWRLTALQLG